jgi:N-acetylmuramic acid 6-phosphate etherase
MAKMGRILGNYMVYINISNKKLIDRATRIVSDLCNISYDEANYQLFLTKLILEEQKIDGKAAIETINRLNGKM